MSAPKLTEAQRSALRGFASCAGGTMNDYQRGVFGIKLATLQSMQSKGFASWDLMTDRWSLTPAGLASLKGGV